MRTNTVFILVMMALVLNLAETHRLKVTKIFCNNTDKEFAIFKTCRVKAVARDLQYYQIYIKLLQLPITDIEVRFRFLKMANGFKPFLYDFTFKCDFIKHLNPVTRILWTWFKDSSNLNHSCPLTEDFEIKNLTNRYLQQQLQVLPVPDGDYGFFAYVTFQKKLRMVLQFYATVQN